MQAAGSGHILTIYTHLESPRLKYVLNWILSERLGVQWQITEQIPKEGFFISYGSDAGAISIPAMPLLNERGISQQDPVPGKWGEVPTIFAMPEENLTVPFDIFSAVFFLLSRYEEYYSYTPDKHGRYPAEESILYKQGWLRRPLADEWVSALGKLLRDKGFETKRPAFFFQPSYDIDIAYSYLHKGRRRSLGAFLRDLLKGNARQLGDRISVGRGKRKDPYDSFDRLRGWHRAFNYKPLYFILASLQTTDFDKNILPGKKRMRELIAELSAEGEVGIHPSYYSDRFPAYRSAEKEILEQITGANITSSRQHYIKLKMPETYHALLKEGITNDYSMGYGAFLGFRAGTGSSFLWYDLEQEQQAALRVHPFCFMDTTALYEEKMNAEQAFSVLLEMKKALEQSNSSLITVFHNFSLGTAPEWKGWAEAYERFISR